MFLILWFPLSDLNLFTNYNLFAKAITKLAIIKLVDTSLYLLICSVILVKKNVIRNASELCSCIYLILQYAIKRACLSLNPVMLFFYFTWLCGLGKGSVPIRLV